MERLFWVCVGGAVGTAARYGIALWAAGRFGAGSPSRHGDRQPGRMLRHRAGHVSVAIGSDWPETLRLALTVGFLGGFTTYSSFNYEASRLLLEGTPSKAALYRLSRSVAGWSPAGWALRAAGRSADASAVTLVPADHRRADETSPATAADPAPNSCASSSYDRRRAACS